MRGDHSQKVKAPRIKGGSGSKDCVDLSPSTAESRMIISVKLSRGAQRMASKHVIVKQLASIQNLGSMDVLCTDKTGTLTEAHIHLERHID